MNWKEIIPSSDWTHFIYRGQPVFGKTYHAVLKFHAPGLAPVREEEGWKFIDVDGKIVIPGPFFKAWGFYEGHSAVEDSSGCFHIDAQGTPAYADRYAWCGNFQNGYASVCNSSRQYFHIQPDGSRPYQRTFQYVGDFKNGIACATLAPEICQHINRDGKALYKHHFHDLGIFHKGIATARDENGWFHIDRQGQALYTERYRMLEPFYNGLAYAERLDGTKCHLPQNK